MSQSLVQAKTVSTLTPDTKVKYLSLQAELELLLQQVRTTPQKYGKA